MKTGYWSVGVLEDWNNSVPDRDWQVGVIGPRYDKMTVGVKRDLEKASRS